MAGFEVGPPTTLTQKLFHALHGDDASGAMHDAVWEPLSRREVFDEQPDAYDGVGVWGNNMLDWGTIYGIAFGLARAESPFEATESVGQRALGAAQAYWDDYTRGESPLSPPWTWPTDADGRLKAVLS